MDLCRSMDLSTRMFSFGLGTSPSRSFVKGFARSTNGRFVFIPPKSSVDVYVREQLQKALQPSITNVHVQWKLGVNVQSAPTQSPPVYANDRLIVYALTNDKTIPFDYNSSVELQTEPGHRLLGVAKINSIPDVADNQIIACLAAKTLILELQHANSEKPSICSRQSRFKHLMASNEESVETISDKKTIKPRIINLSLKYNILSPHTAFIGIEKQINASNADMVLREIPIEISDDDKQLLTSRLSSSAHTILSCHADTLNRTRGMVDRVSERTDSWSSTRRMSNPMSESVAIDGCRSLDIDGQSNRLTSDAVYRCADGGWNGDSKIKSVLDGLKNMTLSMSSNILAPINNKFTGKVKSKNSNISQKDNILPSNDQDMVRYLINKQKFNSLWDLDSDIIKELTGKSFDKFQLQNTDVDDQILNSIIVILILETRFSSFSSLWYGIVQKARNRIIDLFGKDSNNIDKLFNDIRNKL
jgi:hypothetical protein